ncbi:MAG TPA: NAD(+) synthase [Bryobacteraceae bacterium]|nr:NAD(+) synthase [Bryobacteraceae bacterium]
MLVHEFLERSAAQLPAKTALVCGEQRLTYAEVDERASRLAQSLASGGIERGDRVAVLLESSIEAAVSIFAILKVGAVFAVLHPSTKSDKLRYILNNCRAKGLITLGEPVDTPHLRGVWTGSESSSSPTRIAPPTIDADLAALIYTSGSTGRPKGVMMTHLNIVSAATSITTYLENAPDDVILNALPLSFDYGLYQVLMAFLMGATLVLLRSFAYPYVAIETLIREKVTGFPIVPAMAAMLLEMDLAKYEFPSLRYLSSTGAVLPPAHIAGLRRAFPKAKIYSMYGLTECKRVSYLPPEQLDIRPGSVGKGMPNEEVYLVNETGERLGPGQVGQLVVRGSHVMKGYWELPAETDAVLKPGPAPGERVLYTGDLFRMDDEGYLYFVGRNDDMLKVGGYRVSPREIEEVLHEMPGIAEAVVIGVPDPVLGQAIQAVIRSKDGAQLTAREVQRFCARHLEDYMIPKSVEFREMLPKTSSGKLARRELAPTLQIDPAATSARIQEAIRRQVLCDLRRKGVVIGLSGGVDSSVVAALAVRALGKDRVLGLFMPERDSSADSLRLSHLLAESLDIDTRLENIGPILEAAGCYERRDQAIRTVLPDYGPGWRSKIVLPDMMNGARYAIYSVVAEGPHGEQRRARLTAEAYLEIVAATNFKQRTRKMIEYYWADRLRYAVAGTPNRLEYDLGFFVKNGDGAADLKPIAHLYKTQVYELAQYLGIPDEISRRQPTTETYSLPQSQEEFYFCAPLSLMDQCLWGRDRSTPPEQVAQASGMAAAQVERLYQLIDAQRKAAQYLHAPPLLAS